MRRLAAAIVASFVCAAAHAHSASDAYLALDVKGNVIEARWDIALRDLHFVLGLDDDGDGAVTWGEVKRHRAVFFVFAYGRLRAGSKDGACAIERGEQLVSARADGGYAALSFRIVCNGRPRKVTIDYRLLFDVDPTHRGIVVVRNGSATATSLVSPTNARIELTGRGSTL
jgi:hypothetical protein